MHELKWYHGFYPVFKFNLEAGFLFCVRVWPEPELPLQGVFLVIGILLEIQETLPAREALGQQKRITQKKKSPPMSQKEK